MLTVLSRTSYVNLNVSRLKTTLLLLGITTLAACGGSSSESDTPTTPVISQPPVTSETPEAVQPLELPDVEVVVDENPISAEIAVNEMGIGINLGNTLDAPTEGEWAPVAEEQVIIDFKEAGFKHVRIPVTWNNRTEKTAPYTIDTAEMDRVEEVVDWALDQNLYVILNVHHDDWLKKGDNTFTQENRNRFDAIWLQIVERFKNKSAKLLFEILNEPVDLTSANVDILNVRVLEIIRRTNPTRLVVFSGNDFTPLNALLAAAIPDAEDEYLIGNFHAYDPWPFAGQCLQRWGSESDKDELENIYKEAQAWSLENDIPVTVNEFGAAKFDFTAPENICELEDRLQYLESHVEFATEYGISATFWDDAGSFSSYNRATGEWGPEKDILVAPNLPILTIVEAENFQRYFDTTSGNEGTGFLNSTGDYVDGDVDIVDSDGQGQFVVGWTDSSEWLEYDITLKPGTYIISTSVAKDSGDSSYTSNYSLLLDGEELGSDTVENTGSFLTYESHNVALTTVERGSYTLRLNINSGGFNLDKIIFTPDDGSFTPTLTE
jgi:endoglucanase